MTVFDHGDVVGLMDKNFQRRRRLMAVWWMLVPAALLLPFRDSALAPLVCGTSPNLSYDAMLIAATFGIGIASAWLSMQSTPSQDSRVGSALDVFECSALASLCVLYGLAGIYGSALVWGLGLALQVVTLVQQWRAQSKPIDTARPPRTFSDWIASLLFVGLGAVFVAFPVTQPWTGPVEPFVRWHPFSPQLETIWRGLFGSFALAMIVASTSPGIRHRSFALALGCSGILHGLVMAVDNLWSMKNGAPNGNVEHLYGDVVGWTLIGALSLGYWISKRDLILHSRPALGERTVIGR
jgi:hypothetical protein